MVKGLLNILVVISTFSFMQVRSQYAANIWTLSTLVNPGDIYVAYCNVPGMDALGFIQKLKVKWFHNNQAVTTLCDLTTPELSAKYACKVETPQTNNISLELTIMDVNKSDVGNLTCKIWEKIKVGGKYIRDDLVAEKSVIIQIRETDNKTSDSTPRQPSTDRSTPPIPLTSTSSPLNPSPTPTTRADWKKTSLTSLQKNLLQTEKRKVLLEIDVLKLQKEKLKLEIDLLKLKKSKFNT